MFRSVALWPPLRPPVCVRPVLPALPAWTCPLVSLDMANLVLLQLLRLLPLHYPPATTTFCGLLSEPSAAARRVANISGHRVTVTNHQRNPCPCPYRMSCHATHPPGIPSSCIAIININALETRTAVANGKERESRRERERERELEIILIPLYRPINRYTVQSYRC